MKADLFYELSKEDNRAIDNEAREWAEFDNGCKLWSGCIWLADGI